TSSTRRWLALFVSLWLVWQHGLAHPLEAPAVSSPVPSLPELVWGYLRTEDAAQAPELLGKILKHPEASVPTLGRMVAAGPNYGPQPVGRQPAVPVVVRG